MGIVSCGIVRRKDRSARFAIRRVRTRHSPRRTHSVRTPNAHTVTFAATAVTPVRYAIQRCRKKSQERSARDRKREARYVYLVCSLDSTVFDAKSTVNIVERARGHIVIATCADNREIGRSRGSDIVVTPRSYVEKGNNGSC